MTASAPSLPAACPVTATRLSSWAVRKRRRDKSPQLGADYLLTDFADLTEVRRLADELLSRYPQIDVLANNAGGVMSKARELTKDGHERTFQVNHLAPLLLTTLLMDRLIESRAAVLNTASEANYRFGDIDINDLDGRKRVRPLQGLLQFQTGEHPVRTKELHRRYHRGGLATVAFHPGNVASNFAADSGSFLRFVYTTPLKRLLLIDTEKGSDELVWLASTTPDTDWQSGGYYDRHKPGRTNAQGEDPHLARELWERSEAMVRTSVCTDLAHHDGRASLQAIQPPG